MGIGDDGEQDGLWDVGKTHGWFMTTAFDKRGTARKLG